MFYITVVTYNKKLDSIAAAESLCKFMKDKGKDEVNVIIVDNSTKVFLDRNSSLYPEYDLSDGQTNLVLMDGVFYIRNNKNLGLSKAYNVSIKHALRECDDPENTFMMFLDDDTAIPYEYLSMIYDTYKEIVKGKKDINVLTGMIRSNGQPMSPMHEYKLKFMKDDYITQSGIYDDIICINSGMTVRLSCLKKIKGYSEELFLDMTDFLLLYNLSRRGLCRVQVIDYCFEQDFSGRNNTDKKYQLKRFEIFKKDFSKYCEKTGKSKVFINAGILKRRIAIEYKTGE